MMVCALLRQWEFIHEVKLTCRDEMKYYYSSTLSLIGLTKPMSAATRGRTGRVFVLLVPDWLFKAEMVYRVWGELSNTQV